MNIDAIRAVEVAAATYSSLDFEHEHSAPELQAAVAQAVRHGLPIKDVAAAAHMTSLEVLDAADNHTYSGAVVLPWRRPTHYHPGGRPPGGRPSRRSVTAMRELEDKAQPAAPD